MEPATRRTFAAALATVVAFGLAGCGGSSNTSTGTGDQSLSATPIAQAGAPPSDAKVIAVTVAGDTVTPSGTKVEVGRDQPIVFDIDADVAGELHVHSSPAKAIEYPAGKSRVQITIDKPGEVEAEIEQLGTLVVQLEVR